MKLKGAYCIFFLIILVPNLISAATVTLPAVTKDDIGLTTTLNVSIIAGTGQVFITTSPLTSMNTQKSTKDAVNAAKAYLKNDDLNRYDILFSIDSVATQVDGPSAGAAMALGVIAEMQQKEIPSTVSLTGTINAKGEIGYVGGIFEKANAAQKNGVKLFIIPKGEAMQTALVEESHEVTPGHYTTTPISKKIDLREYAPKTWNMVVVEANSLDDVVDYAFAIDINSIVVPDETKYPEFDAPPLALTPKLKDFKVFVVDLLQQCQANVNQANNALSKTTITDQKVIKIIGSEIGKSQDLINQANKLIDKNYLYTAANYAFLASNSANLATEILDHPSALVTGSEYYKNKKAEVRKKLNILMSEFAKTKMTKSNADWIVSSKQRALWAKTELDNLDSIINIQGTSTNSSGLSNLRTVINAFGWINSAGDMLNIAKTKGGTVLDTSPLATLANNKLITIEDIISTTTISADNEELFYRYFNGAKEANAKGWYLTSIYSSAVANGILESQQITDQINDNTVDSAQLLNVLKSDLNNMSDSAQSAPAYFAELFWQHASYYKNTAEYHKNHEKNDKALSELSTGILLMFASKELVDYSNEAYEQIIFTNKTIEGNTGSTLINATPNLIETILAIVTILSVLAMSALLLIKTKHHFKREPIALPQVLPQAKIEKRDVSLDIKTYESALKHAREDYHKKKISKSKYDNLSLAYENKLNALRAQQRR